MDTDIALTMGKGCAEKSQGLAKQYELIAQTMDCHYLDANKVLTAKPNDIDFMHLTESGHGQLAADWLTLSLNHIATYENSHSIGPARNSRAISMIFLKSNLPAAFPPSHGLQNPKKFRQIPNDVGGPDASLLHLLFPLLLTLIPAEPAGVNPSVDPAFNIRCQGVANDQRFSGVEPLHMALHIIKNTLTASRA